MTVAGEPNRAIRLFGITSGAAKTRLEERAMRKNALALFFGRLHLDDGVAQRLGNDCAAEPRSGLALPRYLLADSKVDGYANSATMADRPIMISRIAIMSTRGWKPV